MSHSVEQRKGGQRGLAQGDDHLPQDLQLVGTVDVGGFFQAGRDGRHKVAHQNQVICADGARQDQRPVSAA